jgi:hypothetical protein
LGRRGSPFSSPGWIDSPTGWLSGLNCPFLQRCNRGIRHDVVAPSPKPVLICTDRFE